MNENAIKAKFLALYLGQKVLFHPVERIAPVKLAHYDLQVDKEGFEKSYIQLRSIADLTDGEIKICAKLLWDKWDEATETKVYLVIEMIREYLINENLELIPFYANCRLTDYLRSIGILLPFTYLNDQNEPITLTPEQIIEKGWVKVK